MTPDYAQDVQPTFDASGLWAALNSDVNAALAAGNQALDNALGYQYPTYSPYPAGVVYGYPGVNQPTPQQSNGSLGLIVIAFLAWRFFK